MKIRLANAPVSWGIFEFAGLEPPCPWAQVLDEIAETGYVGTELGPYGYLPTDPVQLKSELDRRGLKLLSAFVPVNLVDRGAHETGLESALQVGRLLAALEAPMLVLADNNGSVPELVSQAGRRRGTYLQDWKSLAEGVELVRRRVADELGLTTVFHHHCAGHVETPEETEALLERSQVQLCLDTGHWHYAGGDSVECLKRWGSRVGYLHLKDCHPGIAQKCREQKLDYFAAVKAGLFCPLGEGEVDFPGLLAELARQGYDGWAVVEQDVLVEEREAPGRFARQNREYLQSIGLVKE
ncbi:MAG: TIM barrel protein [Candidatus Eremiobacteraeota bacterium]|nr:TIM barrel protein [Candidatus Eremiobacteraeota bacterium]MCW5871427.1 TIM barrel protein [Candidatus Eremiobacteraeota bacterium]